MPAFRRSSSPKKVTHPSAELLSISFEKKWTKETARGPAPATPDKRHIGGEESIDPLKAVRQPFPNSTALAVSNMRKGVFCSAKSPHVPAESLYSYRRGLFILFTVQQLSGSPTSQKVAAKLHFLRKRRNSGMSMPCRLRCGKRYAACSDEPPWPISTFCFPSLPPTGEGGPRKRWMRGKAVLCTLRPCGGFPTE